jgi:hypothetical protein
VRDSRLRLKQDITAFFDKVIKNQVTDILSADVMKDIILAVVKRWPESSDLEITVNENEIESLKKVLFKGVKIKSVKEFNLNLPGILKKGSDRHKRRRCLL